MMCATAAEQRRVLDRAAAHGRMSDWKPIILECGVPFGPESWMSGGSWKAGRGSTTSTRLRDKRHIIELGVFLCPYPDPHEQFLESRCWEVWMASKVGPGTVSFGSKSGLFFEMEKASVRD